MPDEAEFRSETVEKGGKEKKLSGAIYPKNRMGGAKQ